MGGTGRAVCLACVLVVGAAGGAHAQSSAPDSIAIAAASRAFSEAYVRGDTARIRSLYAVDAVLLPPGRELRGRDRIARYFAPSARRVNVSHAMESSELRLAGDVAIDVGIWRNTWRIGDEPEQSAQGRYLVVWRRGPDSRWRIEYDMWHRPEA